MSAELLRKAAAKIRENATAATPGPWHLDGPWWIDITGFDMVTGEGRKAVAVPAEQTANGNDMRHIASWHPDVALAVADLIDAVNAEEWCCDECKYGADNERVTAAVIVARAYLGEA